MEGYFLRNKQKTEVQLKTTSTGAIEVSAVRRVPSGVIHTPLLTLTKGGELIRHNLDLIDARESGLKTYKGKLRMQGEEEYWEQKPKYSVTVDISSDLKEEERLRQVNEQLSAELAKMISRNEALIGENHLLRAHNIHTYEYRENVNRLIERSKGFLSDRAEWRREKQELTRRLSDAITHNNTMYNMLQRVAGLFKNGMPRENYDLLKEEIFDFLGWRK